MFDNVTLKIYNLPKNYIPCGKIKVIHRSDINTFNGKIKNMRIYKSPNCLIISGSLAKYLHGENVTPLTREECRQAIKELEEDIGFSLKNAIISSAEFGISIITKEKPFQYLILFWHINKLHRNETSRRTGIETITFTSQTGSFEFIGYDKGKEMIGKKQEIPSLFAGSNVLRLEYRIRKRRGIKAIFKRDLTAYELYDEIIFQKFQKLFFDSYKDMEKMGGLVYIDKSKTMSLATFRKLQAEQYRQNFPKENLFFIQQLKESGKLSSRSIEQLNVESNKLRKDINVLEQSPLVKELDTSIEIMMSGG